MNSTLIHISHYIPLLVPAEFHNLLQYYTKQGFRVIGAAHKTLKVGKNEFFRFQ